MLITKYDICYYSKIEDQNNDKEEYKIKIKCTNLQILIIDILPYSQRFECDMSFLYD